VRARGTVAARRRVHMAGRCASLPLPRLTSAERAGGLGYLQWLTNGNGRTVSHQAARRSPLSRSLPP
jgi:hypothetical protein